MIEQDFKLYGHLGGNSSNTTTGEYTPIDYDQMGKMIAVLLSRINLAALRLYFVSVVVLWIVYIFYRWMFVTPVEPKRRKALGFYAASFIEHKLGSTNATVPLIKFLEKLDALMLGAIVGYLAIKFLRRIVRKLWPGQTYEAVARDPRVSDMAKLGHWAITWSLAVAQLSVGATGLYYFLAPANADDAIGDAATHVQRLLTLLRPFQQYATSVFHMNQSSSRLGFDPRAYTKRHGSTRWDGLRKLWSKKESRQSYISKTAAGLLFVFLMVFFAFLIERLNKMEGGLRTIETNEGRKNFTFYDDAGRPVRRKKVEIFDPDRNQWFELKTHWDVDTSARYRDANTQEVLFCTPVVQDRENYKGAVPQQGAVPQNAGAVPQQGAVPQNAGAVPQIVIAPSKHGAEPHVEVSSTIIVAQREETLYSGAQVSMQPAIATFRIYENDDFINNGFSYKSRLITTSHGIKDHDNVSAISGMGAISELDYLDHSKVDSDLVFFRKPANYKGVKITLRPPVQGERVYIMTYKEHGEMPVISNGVVSGPMGGGCRWYYTCDTAYGDCGAPIVANDGKVVGFHVGGGSTGAGVNSFIGITDALLTELDAPLPRKKVSSSADDEIAKRAAALGWKPPDTTQTNQAKPHSGRSLEVNSIRVEEGDLVINNVVYPLVNGKFTHGSPVKSVKSSPKTTIQIIEGDLVIDGSRFALTNGKFGLVPRKVRFGCFSDFHEPEVKEIASHKVGQNPTKASHQVGQNPIKEEMASHKVGQNPTKAIHQVGQNPTKGEMASHKVGQNPTKSHKVGQNPTKEEEKYETMTQRPESAVKAKSRANTKSAFKSARYRDANTQEVLFCTPLVQDRKNYKGAVPQNKGAVPHTEGAVPQPKGAVPQKFKLRADAPRFHVASSVTDLHEVGDPPPHHLKELKSQKRRKRGKRRSKSSL